MPERASVDEHMQAIRKRLARPLLPQQFAPQEAYVLDFQDVTTCPFGGAWTTVGGGTAGAVPSGAHILDSNGTAHTWVIPAQKRAAVKYFALDPNNEVGDVFIRFRFQINGSSLFNYQAPPANYRNLSQPTEIWIVLDQLNSVDLQLQNLDDTQNYFVLTRLVLWLWDAVPLPGLRGEI